MIHTIILLLKANRLPPPTGLLQTCHIHSPGFDQVSDSYKFSSEICVNVSCAPPTGNLCQVNVNECGSSPCLNKGTCVDGVASFTCLCELPYNGPTCAEVLTPCSPNPCANHAMCTHTADYLGYQCNCNSGWQGKLMFLLIYSEIIGLEP